MGDEIKPKDKKVCGDSLCAYKDQNNNSLDMDEDGTLDFMEFDTVNITEQQNASVYHYVNTHNEK